MNSNILIDGQAQVVLAVETGDASIVRGSFVFSTSLSVSERTIEIPYKGDGYPVAALIYVKGGAYNTNGAFYKSSWTDTVGICSISKNLPLQTPNWTNIANTSNQATEVFYKKGSRSTVKFEAAMINDAPIFVQKSADASNPVYFKSSTQMSVCIAGGSATRGFMSGVEYEYIVVYSK